jgi:hypothetical protein
VALWSGIGEKRVVGIVRGDAGSGIRKNPQASTLLHAGADGPGGS